MTSLSEGFKLSLKAFVEGDRDTGTIELDALPVINQGAQLPYGSCVNTGAEGCHVNTASNHKHFAKISAGLSSSCVAMPHDKENQAVCWGQQQDGALGNGSTDSGATEPGYIREMGAAFQSSSDWYARGLRALSLGGSFGCGILDDQAINPFGISQTATNNSVAVCWGRSHKGQLGSGTKVDSGFAVAVLKNGTSDQLENIRGISAGLNHACALDEDGKVWCWGLNQSGQLGDNSTENRSKAVKVQAAGGGDLSNVVSVASGGNHSPGDCCRDGWLREHYRPKRLLLGDNSKGQLGGVGNCSSKQTTACADAGK